VYINYTLATTDGRVMTGIIAGESATSLTLKRAEGASDTVLRTNIDELVSTGISIMPEGVEKEITPEQMADVIALLRQGG
jgi:putative heme-binding domain-containing protein